MVAEETFLKKLVGEKCWHVSVGGVTEPSFLLALGELVPCERPLRNQAQPESYRNNMGSVELLVWCSWLLQFEDAILASSAQDPLACEELEKLAGCHITKVECFLPARDLVLDFSGGKRLVIFCDRLSPDSHALPNWDLFMCDLSLSAGPGTAIKMSNPDLDS